MTRNIKFDIKVAGKLGYPILEKNTERYGVITKIPGSKTLCEFAPSISVKQAIESLEIINPKKVKKEMSLEQAVNAIKKEIDYHEEND